MASKLKEIAYELKNLWNYLSRKELCDYYAITDRTLYNYQNKLKLPKKVNTDPIKVDKPITILVNRNGQYQKQEFKNWEHFAIREKAQSHSIKIDSVVRGGTSVITCDFLSKRKEAENYEKKLKL